MHPSRLASAFGFARIPNTISDSSRGWQIFVRGILPWLSQQFRLVSETVPHIGAKT
jgi:hypothetical protein